ncbi:MAG: DUF3327 domain-containing protein [Gemmatimonadales bacterium]|nr:DUF3327 domain-containing protein [Gemmatimonadales bacterium]
MTTRRRSAALCLIAHAMVRMATAQPPGAPPSPPSTIDSPTMAALRTSVGRVGTGAATRAFWDRARTAGLPLLEDVPGDTGQMLVTFAYRDTAGIRNVSVLVYGWVGPVPPMERVPGTDVWFRSVPMRKDTRLTYTLLANDPALEPGAPPAAFPSGGGPDPFNPAIDSASLGSHRSIILGPRAMPQPWIAERPGVPRGALHEHTYRSALLGAERPIRVYTPPGYDSAAARRAGGLPVAIFFDGQFYSNWIVPSHTTIDNLISERRIPLMIGIFVGLESRSTRLGDLMPNPKYADFVATELLPWVRERYAITNDPARTAAIGSSAGGIAASYLAFRHPGVVGAVGSQSGSYWWAPPADPEPGWLQRQYAGAPKKAIRFWMDIGLYEARQGNGGSPSMLNVNRHFRDVLRAKGYEVEYREYAAGHDYLHWRGTVGEALLHLFGPRR